MGINATGIEQAHAQPDSSALYKLPHSGEYAELILRLFRSPSSLALIGATTSTRTAKAARGIAAEIGSLGARAVIVRVDELLRAESPPVGSRCGSGAALNVWFWPPPSVGSVGFTQNPEGPRVESDWLLSLSRDFDAVLLDCPAVETSPLVVGIAALCDATVLVVEAALTLKQQVQEAQQTLVISGVKLAGSILMKRR